jgi:hypothetical protein
MTWDNSESQTSRVTTDQRLDPEHAVRLLRAKAGELETLAANELQLLGHDVMSTPLRPRAIAYLHADIALIAGLLADFIERNMIDRKS